MNIGRPLEFDPDIALEAAMQLFWRHGYESSSLQQLLKSMGLSKSSFYQTFKSKEQLFKDCISHYEQTQMTALDALYTESADGLEFIEAVFDGIANECQGNAIRRGCLLINTASEFAQEDPAIAAQISASLDRIHAIFRRALDQAQRQKLIGKDQDTDTLARYLLSAMSGLKNMAKAGATTEAIKQINTVTLSVLKTQQ